MSIRNLQNNQHKEWLDGKFDVLNARQFAFTSGDSAVFANTAVLEIGGDAGSIGEILKKDANNKPAWGTPHIFGEVIETYTDHESTPFSTTSLTPVVASTHTTASLAVGTYVVHYQCEIENTTFSAVADFYESVPTPTVINSWQDNSGLSQFKCVSGFKVITVGAPTAYTYQWRLWVTGGTGQMRRVRLILYKVL